MHRYNHGTRFCFICSHLAARVQRVSHRGSDYREISGRMKGLAVWNGECPILSIYEYRGSFMMVYMVDLMTIFYLNVSLFF